ncbi:MAG: hypothetical protein U0528_20715 [Anaerolineae bacterium]
MQLIENAPVRLQVLVEGSVIVIYINDQVALSTRGYEHRGHLRLVRQRGQRHLQRYPAVGGSDVEVADFRSVPA